MNNNLQTGEDSTSVVVIELNNAEQLKNIAQLN